MRNRARTFLVTLLVLLCSGLVFANGTNEAADKAQKITLGFSFGQSVHPFFIAMEKGARDAAKENNVELVVTSANYKVENQAANIENLMVRGVKAILLNPVDSKALAPVVAKANEKNIPVITVDIAVIGAKTAAHIASDNVEIGRMAARYIAQQAGGTGTMGFIGIDTVTSTIDREKGFMEIMEQNPGIKIVAKFENGMEREPAMNDTENMLVAHPDINLIFGVNEASAMGALSAVRARNLSNVMIVGVDTTPDMLNAIKSNTAVKATIAQDPYQMGRTAVETALTIIKGESVPSVIPVKTDLVTAANVDGYITRDSQFYKK